MGALFFVVMAGVIVVVAIGATKARADALNQAWGKAADQLGLSLKPAAWNKSPQLEGEVSGFPVKVDFEKRGSGNARSIWTRFKLGVPVLPGGLELKREGFLSGISRAFGVHDIETGDEVFDSHVLVKGHDKAAILEFLTPDRRADIRRFLESHSGASVKGGSISWATRGRMRDSARVLVTVDEMHRLARALAGDEGQEGEVGGLLDDAMAILREGNVAAADSAASGATPALGKGAALLAGVGALPAVAAAAMPVAPNAEPDVSPAATPMGGADSLDLAAFCAAVFAPGALSFAATKQFEAYRGQRVRWSGRLRSAEPYRFDFVFGSGPGVRATLAVDAPPATAAGNHEVKAVIALADGHEALQQRIGEPLGFSGTLFKVDGFAKTVFLTEARLL
jgi:hypothetical protein